MGDCQAETVEEFWGKVKDVLKNEAQRLDVPFPAAETIPGAFRLLIQSLAGKLPNGVDAKDKAVALKVSVSGYANVGRMTAGAIIADFAPIVTVNKVKKVLSIHTNLWFDRSDDHAEGVGGAELVE